MLGTALQRTQRPPTDPSLAATRARRRSRAAEALLIWGSQIWAATTPARKRRLLKMRAPAMTLARMRRLLRMKAPATSVTMHRTLMRHRRSSIQGALLTLGFRMVVATQAGPILTLRLTWRAPRWPLARLLHPGTNPLQA